MSTENKVHCVVVTPEKTELDTRCDSLIVPMFDGELGIQFDRAPMIGRLGYGMLRIASGNTTTEWFVDGGFVQVTREAVYLMTDQLLKPEKLDRKQAESDLETASAMDSGTPETAAFKQRAIDKARAKIRLAK